MTKNNLIKFHIDNYTGQDSTTKIGKNTLPTQPKALHETMCDAIIEFDDNFKVWSRVLQKEIENNPGKYDTSNFKGNQGYDFYLMKFPNLKLGYGYTGHIGVLWSPEKEVMAAIVSKKFRLNGSKTQYAIVVVSPKYGDEPNLGVFTDEFLKEYARLTGLGEDEFVLLSSHSGLLSARGENVRWVVDKGLCVGYKLECFYYFHKFTSSLMFQSGNHTKKDLKRLENDMWDVTI